MKSFQEIKESLHGVTVEGSGRAPKYGAFLEKLVTGGDRRGEDEQWDLWYFSFNTDFCRESARYFLDEICNEVAKHKEPDSAFNVDMLRRLHGCLCFYLYSALESFAHEINIFYDMHQDRRMVSLKAVSELLAKRRGASALSKHLQEILATPVMKVFLDYRNAIMHGYVYPIRMAGEHIGIGKDPRSPLFSFDKSYYDVLDFSEKSYATVDHLIVRGWQCFEQDELTE
jgi:hypothetical protein